jgi:hypothetical protein
VEEEKKKKSPNLEVVMTITVRMDDFKKFKRAGEHLAGAVLFLLQDLIYFLNINNDFTLYPCVRPYGHRGKFDKRVL